ncbi:MAG: hypothetical protein HYY24_14370 [Verrucomicrobia bacterium]|nr:hypothetical protein [Verrucomicrobiota bacterium]
MGLFKKKADPIRARARVLNAEIARLQSEIDDLHAKTQHRQTQPRLRSTALPHGQSAPRPAPVVQEPIFEEVNHQRVTAPAESVTTPAHYNELGVRKYDLLALWRRLLSFFRPPAPANPRLVTYLVAGNIKGLQPLRYEKRVARNRFLGLSVLLVLVLWGLAYAFFRNR